MALTLTLKIVSPLNDFNVILDDQIPVTKEKYKEKPEANIIKKKDKLLGRFIPYFTCKIWNKMTQ